MEMMEELNSYLRIFTVITEALQFTPWREAPISPDKMMMIFIASLHVKDEIRYYLHIPKE